MESIESLESYAIKYPDLKVWQLLSMYYTDNNIKFILKDGTELKEDITVYMIRLLSKNTLICDRITQYSIKTMIYTFLNVVNHILKFSLTKIYNYVLNK